jgi:hypothetical protein
MLGATELVNENKPQVRTFTKSGTAIVDLASIDLSANRNRCV